MESVEKKLYEDKKITPQQMRRELAKIFHPAIYGDESIMKEINVAFDAALGGNNKMLGDIYEKYVSSPEKESETGDLYSKEGKSYKLPEKGTIVDEYI